MFNTKRLEKHDKKRMWRKTHAELIIWSMIRDKVGVTLVAAGGAVVVVRLLD